MKLNRIRLNNLKIAPKLGILVSATFLAFALQALSQAI
jgi:hypothetical protein